MRHLKTNGVAVFLHVPLAVLLNRVGDFATRGIAREPQQSFEQLYAERSGLYRRYADRIIDCTGLGHEQVAERICRELPECCGCG